MISRNDSENDSNALLARPDGGGRCSAQMALWCGRCGNLVRILSDFALRIPNSSSSKTPQTDNQDTRTLEHYTWSLYWKRPVMASAPAVAAGAPLRLLSEHSFWGFRVWGLGFFLGAYDFQPHQHFWVPWVPHSRCFASHRQAQHL